MTDKKNEEWFYYIIPDLKNWAQSKDTYYFETFGDAKTKFEELRGQAYNNEPQDFDAEGKAYGRLVLGMTKKDNTAAELIQVKNGKNYLVEDFVHMPNLNSDATVLATLSAIADEIGFDRVHPFGGEDISFAEWNKNSNSYFDTLPIALREKSDIADKMAAMDSISVNSPMYTAMLQDFSLMADNAAVVDISSRYSEALKDLEINTSVQPRMAILQLREDNNSDKLRAKQFVGTNFLAQQGLEPNAEDYEIVYVEVGEMPPLEKTYERFNARGLRPSNYYGHSLSIGDVVVECDTALTNKAHFVDTVGFTALPNTFISQNISNRIRLGMDVKTEYSYLQTITSYAELNGLKELQAECLKNDRLNIIQQGYKNIFELALKRGILEQQDKLKVIYDYEKQNAAAGGAEITEYSTELQQVIIKQTIMTENSAAEIEKYVDEKYNIAVLEAQSYEADKAADAAHREHKVTEETPMETNKLQENSDKIKVKGHIGTWYVIDKKNVLGVDYYLLESEQFGDETAALIVDAENNLVMDEVYNGFDDLSDYLAEQEYRFCYRNNRNTEYHQIDANLSVDKAWELYNTLDNKRNCDIEIVYRDNSGKETVLMERGEDGCDYIKTNNFVPVDEIENAYVTEAIAFLYDATTGQQLANIRAWEAEQKTPQDKCIAENATSREIFLKSREVSYIRAVTALTAEDVQKMLTFDGLKESAEKLGLSEAEYGMIKENGYVTYNLTGNRADGNSIYAVYDWKKGDNERTEIANNILTLEIEGQEYDLDAIRNSMTVIADKEKKAESPPVLNGEDAHREHEATEEASKKDVLREKLVAGIQSFMDADTFKNWLSASGKLFYNNYSFQNALLVWTQKPEASYVMGYEAWKEFGRTVTTGAKGAQIFVPVMAHEKVKGGLFSMINKGLNAELESNPSMSQATYRMGQSQIEFTKTRNGLYGYKISGVEKGQFGNAEDCKRFVEHNILNKVVMYFSVGTVFDVKDVATPEYLWVKRGFTKSEMVLDDNGNSIKNKRGEYKILNTPERIERLVTDLDMSIANKDPVKMATLYSALEAVCEKRGVSVSEASKSNDKTLEDGALGYYQRPDASNKQGRIVISEDLAPTEKVATMLHEMAHSDLHSNLDKFAAKMGVERITRNMREIQAEATAYMTAQAFDIETDTSSFAYIASWSNGYEIQDLQHSFEVIYKEHRELMNDIRTELDLMGYNLDITEKNDRTLNEKTVKSVAKTYAAFMVNQMQENENIKEELGRLISEPKESDEKKDALAAQVINLNDQEEQLHALKDEISAFENSEDRGAQDVHLKNMEALKERVINKVADFEMLVEAYVNIPTVESNLKAQWNADPKGTFVELADRHEKFKEMSEEQIKYITTSKYISRELAPFLRKDEKQFVDAVTERVKAIDKVKSKNGTFVEVCSCEQWTADPIVKNGTLCHPRIANEIIQQAEEQIRKLKTEYENEGKYFPYSKCKLTLYTPTKAANGLTGMETRIDIGDGEQQNLADHFEQICKRGRERHEIFDNLTVSVRERSAKTKIIVPFDLQTSKENEGKKNKINETDQDHKTMEEWKQKIENERREREQAAEQTAEHAAEHTTEQPEKGE